MANDPSSNPWLHALRVIRWPAVAIAVLIIGWLVIHSILRIGSETALQAVDRAAGAVEHLEWDVRGRNSGAGATRR